MDSQRHNSIRSFGTLAAPALALRLRRRVGKYSSFSTGPAVPARSYANTQSDHMGARHYIRLAWPRSRYSRRSWKAEIWHLEDVRSACGVERVWPLQETRERLAVLTVADEAEAAGRRDIACNAAHVAHRHRSGRSNGRRATSMPVITSPHPCLYRRVGGQHPDVKMIGGFLPA